MICALPTCKNKRYENCISKKGKNTAKRDPSASSTSSESRRSPKESAATSASRCDGRKGASKGADHNGAGSAGKGTGNGKTGKAARYMHIQHWRMLSELSVTDYCQLNASSSQGHRQPDPSLDPTSQSDP